MTYDIYAVENNAFIPDVEIKIVEDYADNKKRSVWFFWLIKEKYMSYRYRVVLNTEMECYVLKIFDDEIPLNAADFDEAIAEAEEIVQEWA
jgi:hypothetical protein